MGADRDHFQSKVDVSRETLVRLDQYAALLRKWNPAINLVAPSTLTDLWGRHFLDSAQIITLSPENAKTWVDLGSGGGFPGMVIAILAAELHPELRVACIESDLRKATFLRTVARETGLEVQVISDRIEAVAQQRADVVSARALAPLTKLLGLAGRHLGPGGSALFLKGAGYRHEIEEALENWTFEVDTVPSTTDSEAAILRIGEIRRV